MKIDIYTEKEEIQSLIESEFDIKIKNSNIQNVQSKISGGGIIFITELENGQNRRYIFEDQDRNSGIFYLKKEMIKLSGDFSGFGDSVDVVFDKNGNPQSKRKVSESMDGSAYAVEEYSFKEDWILDRKVFSSIDLHMKYDYEENYKNGHLVDSELIVDGEKVEDKELASKYHSEFAKRIGDNEFMQSISLLSKEEKGISKNKPRKRRLN